MTQAQIWLSIVLGFIVLLVLASKIRRGSDHRMRKIASDHAEAASHIDAQLTTLGQAVARLQEQVARVETILEAVE